uniref:Uncharacterized protein n=1 Tax=Nelumbo nucifera TaxID=4432 RepID=A0A822YJC0_NELNU|nr:TPA_asm: hypothetical protein HUJ06_009877 [Nelumbo nucifera]
MMRYGVVHVEMGFAGSSHLNGPVYKGDDFGFAQSPKMQMGVSSLHGYQGNHKSNRV